eukprot:s567_g1.t1
MADHRRGRLALCALALLCVWPQTFLAPGTSNEGGLPRRGALFATSALLAAPTEPARAEVGWQIKLPKTWRAFEQNEMPPPGVKKSTALVVAGNPEQGGELVVLRVPLSTDPNDPNSKGTKDLINYFSQYEGKPSVPINKAVDVVASSQKTGRGMVKFSELGSPSDKVFRTRRYVTYDYEASICPGVVTQGVGGTSCTEPQDSSEIPLFERRHRIVITVTDEGAAKAGEKDPTNWLWLLDISGPAAESRNDWGQLKEAVTEVADSFLLSSDEKVLEDARTSELTPEQMEEFKKLQAEGKLPEDSLGPCLGAIGGLPGAGT